MDFTGFYHETKSNYAYAVDVHTLHLRLRTGRGAANSVTLVIFDPYNWEEQADKPGVYVFNESKCVRLPMRREYTSGCHDFWFAEAAVPSKRAKYAFLAEDETGTYLYGYNAAVPFSVENKIGEMLGVCFVYPYLLDEDIFRAPAWVNDTVWYQIFPERYANSGSPALRKNDLLPWGSETEVNNRQHYGGDLPGVTAHLDDVADLGVTGLYFTPVFTSPSTHKYNTEDYFQIDPAFGDNAALGELVREAHKRGIKIMLDLVFNHIGSTHPFWLDVLEKGKASRYYHCFYIKQDDLTIRRGTALQYETFATVPNMPKWNTADPIARRYLLDAAVYWARTFAVDAFRLDVANEVSHDFWREFRKAVRAVNPEIYIVGEVWEHASPWLMGDQFDAVMNYELTRCIWQFVSGKTDGAGFCEQASAYLASYPKNRQAAMFNLIGSHDTSRILTTAGGRVERVMQAFMLLFTFAGSPCVLYGDEIGLTGEGMDRARQCMIWDESKQNRTLQAFVQKLIALRTRHPAFKAADVVWLKHDAFGMIYVKQTETETVAVLLNARDEPVTLSLPPAWEGKQAYNLLTDEAFTIQKTACADAYGVAVWKID